MSARPTLILVGGFLGAGKTTLLLRSAQILIGRGLRVGLIANDQANDLVDTAMARSQHTPVVEVAGGCFCCRFPDLRTALTTLQRTVAPDVILAEPVGSCTDLMATVIRPLAHFHPDEFRIAPLTVLVDPTREEDRYVDAVRYLFGKQVEEAELIVLTKQDMPLSESQRERARSLTLRFGERRAFPLSAQTGVGVVEWLDNALGSVSTATGRMDVDYATYAAGEAALGWLNASGSVSAERPFSPRNWLSYLLRMVDEALDGQRAVVAHIKAQIETPTANYKASLTQSGGRLAWDLDAPDTPTMTLRFLLNARVQTTPLQLEAAARQAFAELLPPPDFRYEFTHFACFSPAAPQPTYHL